MKVKNFVTALLLIVLCIGSSIVCSCSKDDIDDSRPANRGVTNGHEWVNLGLPSGTLWATCNVGASKPEEFGNYYAWGETKPKSTYSWDTYTYTANYEELPAENDAATVNWGSKWEMPSHEQIKELYNNTITAWTTQNGVNGRKVTSKINSVSIFFPFAGRFDESNLRYTEIRGYYWSRSLKVGNYNERAYRLILDSDSFYDDTWYPPEGSNLPAVGSGWASERYEGFPVRPVRKQ